MSLPTDAAERKKLQLYTFMFGYFPDAWLEVVRIARLGNDQHNPGEPLHWAREKSTDQMNPVFNHLFDYGMGTKKDTDGGYHLAKAIWRLSAQLQLDIEAEAKEAMKPEPMTATEVNRRAEEARMRARSTSVEHSYPAPVYCDWTKDIWAPRAYCYCDTCVRVRNEAATRT